MTLTIEVYEDDNSTLVDTIDPGQYKRANGKHDPLNGFGSIVLPRTVGGVANPALALIEHQRLIRFTDDHDDPATDPFVWTMEIEVVVDVPLSEQEEAGETVTVSGRDWLSARMDKVHVLPDAGLGNLPWHPTRWFNFAADRLRDDDPAGPQGAWPFAYGQLPNYDTNNYFGRPEGFFDTAGPDGNGPEWLWDADTRTLFADAGFCYGRQRFTLAAETQAIFCLAADDNAQLWIDDVPVCRAEGVYTGQCVLGGVRLSAGEHLLSWVGQNRNALRAGVAYAGANVTDGMPDDIFVRSDSSLCRVLAYPDDPPGFTPTEVIRLVVDEQQDAGRLAGVGFSFLSATDTDDAAVSEVTDLTAKAPADTLLTFLKVLSETYLDIDCSYVDGGVDAESDPCDLLMHAWIRGTAGSDVSGSVQFIKGTARNVTHEQRSNERATVALVSGSEFAPFQEPTSNPADIYEVSLDFGEASGATARRFAQEYLASLTDGRRGITLDVVPSGPIPGEDFNVWDTVGVLEPDGTVGDHRVVGIGFDLNADSVVRYTVDLDQPSQALDERLATLMRRQMPGAHGGRTVLPTPVDPQFPANEQGTEEVHTWQWDGPLGEIQVYKNTVAISGALVDAADLTDPGDTAKTTITAAARKFTKGADKIQISAGGGALSPSWIPPKGRFLQEVRATVDDDGETIVITVMVT